VPFGLLFGRFAMPLTIEAIYENGVLKPTEPLPFQEHEKVQVTVHSRVSKLADAYGIMEFQGTVEEADYFARDPELDYPPPPEEA
jgi:predicted DNA-binding antitoxin AbrB/MazE fold protein